jgi:sulfite exporter TauE/SafE
MFIFGIATIPILFTVGFVTGFFKSGKFRKIMMFISGIMVILFGVFTIFKGSMLAQGKKPMKMMDRQMINKVIIQEK